MLGVARATGGMVHRLAIALACGSVAFACFGLSRVKLRRLSVAALLARAPKGMMGGSGAFACFYQMGEMKSLRTLLPCRGRLLAKRPSGFAFGEMARLELEIRDAPPYGSCHPKGD